MVSNPGLSKYEIMEGVTGMTPFGMQFSHVSQKTADTLVDKYPGDWQIVEAADLYELERIWNASAN